MHIVKSEKLIIPRLPQANILKNITNKRNIR